ncbi:MAG: sulfotransferase [Deltaproteobacteria bacterium]|uniref:Sulfotransferase n=1 Tax=Candidatus Zymogenus saltonus TaxID=2844893 RepID=A0A9D8PP30_9DELT|nr:sulfotransferase [Candidatus Zymogenus saltonus]
MISPFFIVGCGRSGTTLLRNILNRHSKIAIPLESLFVIDYLTVKDRKPLSTLKELIVREHEIGEWGLEITPNMLNDCSTPEGLIDRIHELYMEKNGKVIWGQKTPRFIRHGELLKTAYPDSRFIHVIRDPRAVVNSLINSDVHRSNAYYGSFRWNRDVNQGLSLKKRYPEDTLEVRYESLITDPEETLKGICRFIEVNFEREILDQDKTKTKEYSKFYNKINVKIGQPPDPQRLDAWRSDLSRRQISLIESLCAETMKRLGYAPSANYRSPNGIYIFYLRLQRIFGFMRQLFHYVLNRRQYIICNIRRKLKLSLLFGDIFKINY